MGKPLFKGSVAELLFFVTPLRHIKGQCTIYGTAGKEGYHNLGYTTLQESEALRKPQVHTILQREQSREKYHCLANLCTILLMHPLGSPWCIILQGNAPLKELLVKRGVTPIVKAEGTWEELKNTPIKGGGGDDEVAGNPWCTILQGNALMECVTP